MAHPSLLNFGLNIYRLEKEIDLINCYGKIERNQIQFYHQIITTYTRDLHYLSKKLRISKKTSAHPYTSLILKELSEKITTLTTVLNSIPLHKSTIKSVTENQPAIITKKIDDFPEEHNDRIVDQCLPVREYFDAIYSNLEKIVHKVYPYRALESTLKHLTTTFPDICDLINTNKKIVATKIAKELQYYRFLVKQEVFVNEQEYWIDRDGRALPIIWAIEPLHPMSRRAPDQDNIRYDVIRVILIKTYIDLCLKRLFEGAKGNHKHYEFYLKCLHLFQIVSDSDWILFKSHSKNDDDHIFDLYNRLLKRVNTIFSIENKKPALRELYHLHLEDLFKTVPKYLQSRD